jgi:valyl-tRNA synthetase
MTLDRYSPGEIEGRWYRHWMERGRFAPRPDAPREPFCIVIPPPNVTGALHMGHAWDETVQDVLVRWKRMRGHKTLWIPGTDHAGIATQWMVERDLRKAGQRKEELGRAAFLERVWAFKAESHGSITGQLKRLGVSCDWSRERFTLDEGLSRAVRRVFVSLYGEGLIYRDQRMINWSPGLRSAISDLEVEHKTLDGKLWHFRYPLAGGGGHVVVATTRPETMLGDTAVAVHPDDARYRALVGRKVTLPLAGRDIPIVADATVDPKFGSGAVKITPGHDFNDFALGKRHNLPVITILHEDGRLNDEVPAPYRGLDRFEARKRVVADLEAAGLLEKVEAHQLALGVCSRSGVIVEPRVSLQWFVRIQPLAEPAIRAVTERRVRLVPEFQEKIFFEWMNNIQDWCISRQLWWGHRIPVWYCQNPACAKHQVPQAFDEDPAQCPVCKSGEFEQETDVLDTWFSSGLWPFSTMGWPEATEDLKTFYPTSVLVTGYDILFFWVARMVMLGLKFMGDVPFHEVLLHGLLRDQHGEKMSKTKGNGLDPLVMVDKYGADALRFTLASGTVLGQDMVLQEAAIEGNRNFINKLWNAVKFHLGHRERLGTPAALAAVQPGRFDRWILGRLQRVTDEVHEELEARRLNEACRTLYQFVWHELCDWYLEISKPLLGGTPGQAAAAHATLGLVLAASVKLLHPFMPFVTEELWHALQPDGGDAIVQPYPEPGALPVDERAVSDSRRVIALIETVRTVRGESGIKPKTRINVSVAAPEDALRALYAEEESRLAIQALAGVEEMTLAAQRAKAEGEAHGVGNGFEVFIPLAGMIDTAAERQRLEREAAKIATEIGRLSAKLANPSFTGKAPAAVVDKSRADLAGLQAQLTKLHESARQLG